MSITIFSIIDSMKSFLDRYIFKDYLYLVIFVLIETIEEGGIQRAMDYLPEMINALWIIAVLIYVLIPRFLYKGKYFRFFLFYALSIFGGIIIMEAIIEGDGGLGDAFTWFAIEHEGPDLLANSGLIALLKLAMDYRKRQTRLVQLEKEHAESEVKFLKSQLNPHVLFNNLNNIYSFALHRSERTPEMILKLADIMRYMLYESNQELVELDQELEYVKSYIELQKIQLEGRAEIIFEVEGETTDLRIAPMMLISFIENCFKHSSESKTDGLRIIIRIEVHNHTLNLYTENSFEKKESKDALDIGGIGLNNVKRRLDLIYPDRHDLIIKELSQLYIVNLSLELE